jgi:hypothetical protein
MRCESGLMIFKFIARATGCFAGRIGIAALLVLAVTASAARAQTGFDRHGGDYTSFQVRSGDPAVCAQRCDREARCRSWSFAYPGTIGPRAVCYLKADVPTRKEDACCVSGVRGGGVTEPRSGPIEHGIDRAGGDYKSFETTPHADGKLCADACTAENRCRAWTYVRPGYFTTTARCYLKSRVTPPRAKPCCISGVVR